MRVCVRVASEKHRVRFGMGAGEEREHKMDRENGRERELTLCEMRVFDFRAVLRFYALAYIRWHLTLLDQFLGSCNPLCTLPAATP